MKVFEEKDQYVISVDNEKNRVVLEVEALNDPKKVPNFNKHIKEAIEAIGTRGFSCLVILSEKLPPPKFQLTASLKAGQKDFIAGGIGKSAVVVSPKSILQKMTLQVVTKLSGMNIRVFSGREIAETWLDEKN